MKKIEKEKSLTLNPVSPSLADWLVKLSSKKSYLDIELLTRAYQLIEAFSSENEIEVKKIIELAQGMIQELVILECDNSTLVSAIIYPAFSSNLLTLEVATKYFGPEISKLAFGVYRMKAIHLLSSSLTTHINQDNQIDNLRKMSLAMADDARIVLIKLAERLSILKLLRTYSREDQQAEAKQAMDIYAPLANRLGIGQLKWQLEDLAFRYLDPSNYHEISKALKMRRSDREAYIHQLIAYLQDLFHKGGVNNISISGRAKHIYSIYRKIKTKQINFSQIYDITAVRILVNTIKDCYTVLSLVHTAWKHISAEFDDYIAKPKSNGYRSIHTVVIAPNDVNVEIQIRTFQMHEQAELGVAAHWKYKEGGPASNYEQKINWLRSVIDWQKQITHSESNNLFKKTFEDRIYTLTPHGDILDLEAGSTPLDFAYHVHTDIGHRCRGAKVNNILVPLTYILNTGDQVSILTSKEPQPSRDWLNPELGYLKTSRAIQKVRNWFKKQSEKIYLEKGIQLWEKICKREGVNKNNLEAFVSKLNYKTLTDLYVGIGVGDIHVNTIVNRIKNQGTEEETFYSVTSRKKIKTISPLKNESNFIIEDVSNLLTQIARCCKPIPGDQILGYITKGKGISVHQTNCRNILYALDHFPHKVVKVHWNTHESNFSTVDFRIISENRNDLFRDVSNVIANEDVPLISINSRTDPSTNTAYIHLTIKIKTLQQFNRIQVLLKQISGVLQVERN